MEMSTDKKSELIMVMSEILVMVSYCSDLL